jgi:hypothetical protein
MPVAWSSWDDYWFLRTRCVECQHQSHHVLTRDEAEQYEADLDERYSTLREAASRIDREVMEDMAEIFARALKDDLIGPSDFS